MLEEKRNNVGVAFLGGNKQRRVTPAIIACEIVRISPCGKQGCGNFTVSPFRRMVERRITDGILGVHCFGVVS